MLLGNLVKIKNESYKKILVKGICFDSRKIKKNDVFIAIKGNKTSGNKFIKKAISNGASAIITDQNLKTKKSIVPILKVKNARESLSEICANFYRKKPKNIIAVTGTNGKTSVANFFCQILNINKISAGTFGTLGIISNKIKKKSKLTSVDPLQLHKNLQIFALKKINNVILEASSHGLSQKRLNNLKIKIGIFTNLSQDHLDYHKNMKEYLNAKMYLFKYLLNKNSKIITDKENKEFRIINNVAKKRKIKIESIGLFSGTIKILQHSYFGSNQILKIKSRSKIFTLKIPLIGYLQLKNLLMAILAASYCGLNQKKIFNQVHKIKPIPGRLECISNLKNNSKIILDFAHTPNALEQSLATLKKQFKKEITIVFGCGGERDKKKRLLMGKIANKYCRKIFVTDDNPRNENPKSIRNEIINGCKKKAVNIGNRKKAIEDAIKELRQNEILLVAGKGHEQTQDYGKKILNFSDRDVIKKIVKKRTPFIHKTIYQDFLLKKVFKNSKIKNIKYSGVSINSKTIKKNNLFFPIEGKNNDGHKFVKQAISRGAIRSVVSKNIKGISKNKFIKVKNTFLALNDLAKVTRDNTTAKIVGITGSVGKTTLKNLISFALKNYGKVYHSPHSYNNRFGVPLSLNNLKEDTNYGVFEIGMDRKGEIYKLSKIVKPEIAVITNIAGAHFKNFNTLKDIANAKSEIIENILEKGSVVLNRDDKFFDFFSNKAKKKGINVVSFGLNKKADIFLQKIKKIYDFYRIKIIVKKKIHYFYVKHTTNNILYNFLACIAVLHVFNLQIDKISKKFINFKIPSGRGDVNIVRKFKKRFKFIDESYNANPLSMFSAINNMNYYKKKVNSKKLVFLGDMLELGKKSKKFHKELSSTINKSDIDKVFVYGKFIRETFKFLMKNKKGKVFNSLNEAYNYFKKKYKQ